MNKQLAIGACVLAAVGSLWLSVAYAAPKLILPLVRTAYQNNDTILVNVLRSGEADLPASPLVATLTSEDGSKLSFTFNAPKIAAANGAAAGAEYLNLAGQLLRPGSYTLEVAVDGGTASTKFEVYSPVRYTNYVLINWGNPNGPAALRRQGPSDLGYTMIYGGRAPKLDPDGDLIRGGVDFMPVCTMSGGHQMDLRMECDWSDPYVIKGGSQRAAREAFAGRTYGNFLGVHFYDEPGLTWYKSPKTGEATPHDVPAQFQSYKAAFGKDALSFTDVKADDANSAGTWAHWANWKLSFMDAAWWDAKFAVDQVNPKFMSVTQSQYGATAFADGYYFNVARSMTVNSGHGGYHDYGLGYFNPTFFLEIARGRDTAKDNWYLPTWYPQTTNDELRVENYLSFQLGIQGLMTPPPMEPTANSTAVEGIKETNKVMARVGTIFKSSVKSPMPEVAILYSMSANIYYQTRDMTQNYAHANKQGMTLWFSHMAAKSIQQPFQMVTDEDVIDGTLAGNYKSIVIGGVDYLEPSVVKGLEDFAAKGGQVLTFGGELRINGGTDLGLAKVQLPDEEKEEYKKLIADKAWPKLEPFQTVAKYVEGSAPLAKAMRTEFDKAGIKPVIGSDAGLIVATKHTLGEVEYYFAVNATPDGATAKRNSLKPIASNLTIEAGDKPIYDAMAGGVPADLKKDGSAYKGSVQFGNGQMRVFAVTARPIGGVRVSPGVVSSDLTNNESPINLRFAISVADDQGGLLAGVIPLQITVTDSTGKARYSLYRATELGTLDVKLPLAANDAAGKYTITVTDLLGNTKGESSFTYKPASRNNAVAGLSRRAVMFPDEHKNIFRFAREHQAVTIVPGTSAYNQAAAKRLQESLDPWGVKTTIMSVEEASKSRPLTEKEAATWVGLEYTSSGGIKPGAGNAPTLAGYAVQGAVILLGNPEDNVMIKQLQDSRFLPYPAKTGEFPAAGRGYVAWQRDAIGPMQETITAIGYDEAGMSEAVGTLFEAVAGLEPLTRWVLPVDGSVTPASK